MKIKSYIIVIIILFSIVSCENEAFQETYQQTDYKEAIWNYDGDSKVIKNVISEMRNETGISVFEKNIGQRDLVWEKPKFLLVNNDRKIIVPLLNMHKKKVIGVLSLYKNEDGKTNYTLIIRSRLYKNDDETVPFWTKSMWKGYLLALDKDLFNTKNGSPGFSINKLDEEKFLAKGSSTSKTSTWECHLFLYEHCYDWYSQDSEGNEEYLRTTCSYEYEEECFEVDDDDDHDEDCYDQTDPECVNYDPCIDDPCACGDCGGDGGGDLDDDDQIFNELEGKTKCIYNKLENSSTGFSNLIKNFDGEFPVSHLKYKNSSTLPSNINAKTNPPVNFLITIEINENNLSRPNLSIARTIIHETIHAEMFRKILSIIDNGGDLDGLTRSQWTLKLNNGDYPGIFDYYTRFGVNGMQHEQMAAHYRTLIGDFLKEFQPGLSQDIYDSLAWTGLMGTVSWNALTSAQKANILSAIDAFESGNVENCN